MPRKKKTDIEKAAPKGTKAKSKAKKPVERMIIMLNPRRLFCAFNGYPVQLWTGWKGLNQPNLFPNTYYSVPRMNAMIQHLLKCGTIVAVDSVPDGAALRVLTHPKGDQ